MGYTADEARDGFAWIAADMRKVARVHRGGGNANAAKRAVGYSRRLGKLSKNAEGRARREARHDR